MVVSERVQRAAARWIFPGLIAAMVAGNVGWMIGRLPLGQVLSWINDAAAVALVFGRFGGRRWPVALVAATVAAKALTVAGVFPARADLAFDIGLGLLFSAAGAIIVSERPGLVYRQVLIIALVSTPLMVVQMTGVAPWGEALNTEHTEDAAAPQPTLFVSEDNLHYRTAQARPSGFTHSNNFLSLIAVFAIALHFSRLKTPRLTTRDLLVCTFAILTMAKVTLLVLGVVLAWKLLTGLRVERQRICRVIILCAALAGIYALLFPGLFTANTNADKLSYSFFIRANDFAEMLPEGNALKGWLQDLLAGTPRAESAEAGLSGYAQIVRVLPYLLVGFILVSPVLYKGVRNVKRRYPEVVDTTVLTAFVVLLFPTAVPMFRAQIFWFVAGFALLPVFTLWEPMRFPGRLGSLRPARRPLRRRSAL
jgi:hypothetical protein